MSLAAVAFSGHVQSNLGPPCISRARNAMHPPETNPEMCMLPTDT